MKGLKRFDTWLDLHYEVQQAKNMVIKGLIK